MNDRLDRNSDSLVCFGGEVKAMGSGKVAGYLVRYGRGPDDADPQGDYFLPDCDFGLDAGDTLRIYYHHGLSPEFGRRHYGVGEVKARPDGLWIEGTINTTTEKGRRIYADIESGRCGWSSGSASRFVERERDTKGRTAIRYWPLNDASVSATPVDSRNVAIAIKSLTEGEPVSGSLVDRSERLVADAEELLGLFAKAADQRLSDGRNLSEPKRIAAREIGEKLLAIYDRTTPRLAPEEVAALQRQYLEGRI